MAGAFGFKEEHYDVSIKCGERVLLPAVREASRETVIVSDGFSSREQIAQTTGREAMHLSQFIQMAMHGGEVPKAARNGSGMKKAAARGAGALAAGAILYGVRKLRA